MDAQRALLHYAGGASHLEAVQCYEEVGCTGVFRASNLNDNGMRGTRQAAEEKLLVPKGTGFIEVERALVHAIDRDQRFTHLRAFARDPLDGSSIKFVSHSVVGVVTRTEESAACVGGSEVEPVVI